VDELLEEVKGWRASSVIAAKTEPEVKLGNKAGGRGDPFNNRFEAQIRRQMATGVSAEHYRLLLDLDADLMHGEGTEERKAFVTPRADWFSKQREAVGNTSHVHVTLKIASADFVKQHGYDETGIDRVFTMNQWVLLEKDGGYEIVSLKTGGVLTGGTAQERADHIKKVWPCAQPPPPPPSLPSTLPRVHMRVHVHVRTHVCTRAHACVCSCTFVHTRAHAHDPPPHHHVAC
jgi:hypothetical protein